MEGALPSLSGSRDVAAGGGHATGLDAALDAHGNLSTFVGMDGASPGTVGGAAAAGQGASAPVAVMPPALMLVLMRMRNLQVKGCARRSFSGPGQRDRRRSGPVAAGGAEAACLDAALDAHGKISR
jgi:hypothetical protein